MAILLQIVTLIVLILVQNDTSECNGRPTGSGAGNVTVITVVCTL